jgi:large-conductance mechanosensitive channel
MTVIKSVIRIKKKKKISAAFNKKLITWGNIIFLLISYIWIAEFVFVSLRHQQWL